MNSAVKQYREFCTPRGLPDFPVTQNSILAFISHIAPTKTADTVKQIISSLKSHQVDRGYDNSVLNNDAQVQRILRGVSIVNGVKGTQKPKLIRDPITHDLLKRIVRHCDESFDGMTMRAAMCVAFAASSELATSHT
jgi:glutaredoxin 2